MALTSLYRLIMFISLLDGCAIDFVAGGMGTATGDTNKSRVLNGIYKDVNS